MLRQLHGKIRLVVCLVAVCSVLCIELIQASSSCLGATDEDYLFYSSVARALPATYREDFEFVMGHGSDGQQFVLVCATSSKPPQSSQDGAAAFMMKRAGDGWIVIWQNQFNGEWFCQDPRVFSGGLATIVTRPPAGSITVFHLRVYSYDIMRDKMVPLATIEYIDGGYVALEPCGEGKPPAFLVYEPLYDDYTPKSEPQPYRFRLYSPTAHGGYRFACTVTTVGRFNSTASAYDEARESIRKSLQSNYVLPDCLPVGNTD